MISNLSTFQDEYNTMMKINVMIMLFVKKYKKCKKWNILSSRNFSVDMDSQKMRI